MSWIKKTILILGATLFIGAAFLSSIGLYLYYHPERLLPMIERSLCAKTGSSCTIESLSYSLIPLAVEAKGIHLESLTRPQSFSIKVSFIRSQMAFEGPWGHRSLIFKNMQMNAPNLKLFSGQFTLPNITPPAKNPSFGAGIVQDLISFFLFKNIRFQSGEIINGHISAVADRQTVQARQIHAMAVAGRPLRLSLALDIQRSSDNMHFTAPKVNFLGDKTFNITDPNLSGTLQSRQMTLQSPDMAIRTINVTSKFSFAQAFKTLDFDNLKVNFTDIAFKPDSENIASGPISATAVESVSLETALTYDMNKKKIALVPLKLGVSGLALMQKTKKRLTLLDIDLKAESILLSGPYSAMKIKGMGVQIPRAKIAVGADGILVRDIRIRIPKGRIDKEKKSMEFPRILLDTAGLKNLQLAAGLKDDKIDLTLEGSKTALIHSAAAGHLIPSDWNLTAHDFIHIRIAGKKSAPWQVQAKLAFKDLTFQNKNQSLLGENIFLAAEIKGIVDSTRSEATFAATLKGTAGEALYDRYYLNLQTNPIITSCRGTFDLQKRSLALSNLGVNLTGILPLEIQGLLAYGPAGKDVDVTVFVPPVPLKPIVYHFLQEPYKTQKPFLADLETDGIVSAQFKLNRFENAWQAFGHLKWQDGFFSLKEKKIFFKDIFLDLPFWYTLPSAEPSGETLTGRLAVQSMRAPLLPEQPLNISFKSGPNRIFTESATVVRIPGGDLRFGPVEINNIFGPAFSVYTSLDFDRLELQPFLSKLWTHPIEGTLSGTLQPVRYENHTLTGKGALRAEVFGGRILCENLGATGIFTPAPAYTFNARWDDLKLSAITAGTSFGEIEGILKGHLQDAVIAYGQPQKFDLLLETVKTKGIDQKISIRAIDNIAQIGGGQSPFMGLAGAFTALFKKFPYEKIGIHAFLKNDVFTINGTVREGGIEYLVKRGSFSGVNVVNQNPDNRILFKDMVKRIKRITSKSNPVVN